MIATAASSTPEVTSHRAELPNDHGLSFDSLCVRYDRGPNILQNLNLSLKPGEFTVLLGASGSGKTTLIKTSVGLVRPASGMISLKGSMLTGKRAKHLRRKLSMIHQDFGLSPRLSVIQNVMAGVAAETSPFRVMLQAYPRGIQRRAIERLNDVGLSAEHFDRRARDLSGGQMQRVGIARALMRDPEFLLADEPIASLDPMTAVRVMDLLKQLGKRRGMGVLCSLHQIEVARQFADRIVGMRHGKIVFDGTSNELNTKALDEIFAAAPSPVAALPSQTGATS